MPATRCACLAAAAAGGARWIVLCDTNGGRLPHEIARRRRAGRPAGPARAPRHPHPQRHRQRGRGQPRRGPRRRAPGPGHAERPRRALRQRQPGRADPDADAQARLRDRRRRGRASATSASSRAGSTSASTARPTGMPPTSAPAPSPTRAGLHASAVVKDPSSYEHIAPELVGNQRHIVVSDQAGRASLMTRLAEIGLADARRARTRSARCSRVIKEREANGYAYEGADASFELLARRTFGQVPDYFRLISFRIIDERRFNARNELVTLSEATIKVEVGGATRMIVAEGNGPVHALDTALRQALSATYPALEHMHLADYKVRILTPEAGDRRGHPRDHRERRRPGPALVDGRRLDQRDRRLLQRAARRHHLQAVRRRRRRRALNGASPAARASGAGRHPGAPAARRERRHRGARDAELRPRSSCASCARNAAGRTPRR